MNIFLSVLAIIGGFILLNLLFWRVIVPFHFKSAKKIGCRYNPRTNRFEHGIWCTDKCWCQKYKDDPYMWKKVCEGGL